MYCFIVRYLLREKRDVTLILNWILEKLDFKNRFYNLLYK